MPKRLVIWTVALIAGLTLLPILGAQTAAPNGDEATQDKWNNTPPRKSAYAGKKPAPARLGRERGRRRRPQ